MRAPLLLALLLSGTATGSFVPTPAAATSPGLAGLEQQLSLLIAGRSGEYGIAALDLRDGSTVAVNGDTPFPMASTVKLAIAAAYLAQVDRGPTKPRRNDRRPIRRDCHGADDRP